MSDFRTDSGYRALAQVESYWEAVRGNRLMPKRSEIDPRGIETALEFSFVLERIAPGMARLRIAGAHLGDIMGMEVRGMPLTSFFVPHARREVGDLLEDVFQRPAICELTLRGETGFGKPDLEARLVLLPMKSDLGDVSRILGCMVSQGDIGTRPRRFEITKTDLRKIESPATTAPQAVAPVPQPDVLGMAEDAAPFAPKEEAAPPVPYLRLVKSDD